MTFEKAVELKGKQKPNNRFKIYRVCPNAKTDFKGYENFVKALKNNKNLSDSDAKTYSNNDDYAVSEGVI